MDKTGAPGLPLPSCCSIRDSEATAARKRRTLLVIHAFLHLVLLTVVVRISFRSVAVPYLAKIFIAESRWLLRGMHIKKEAPCLFNFEEQPKETCYDTDFTFEVTNVKFPVEFMLVRPQLHVIDGSTSWNLATLRLPPLELSDGCSPCVLTSSGKLRAPSPLNAAKLARLRGASGLMMVDSSDVNLFGSITLSLNFNHTFSLRSANITVSV
ncbi:hypothetical protein FOZ60_012646 [Perkinsus olseni]|uniref:Uncharacterized protein n=1 Tax=Perkinsus olseni TaxID=32597 RepID=A0A7J6P992_PEROL|nr:hypothetical protein FOZ60_012646 [Perkinsus olseni]